MSKSEMKRKAHTNPTEIIQENLSLRKEIDELKAELVEVKKGSEQMATCAYLSATEKAREKYDSLMAQAEKLAEALALYKKWQHGFTASGSWADKALKDWQAFKEKIGKG